MTTITQNIADIVGVDDNTSWTFYTEQLRLSDAGDSIISTKKERKYPVAGVLTVELDPGPAIVLAPDGKRYPFTVPDTDSDLWTLLAGAVGMPAQTTQEKIAAAVSDYLTAHQIDEYHEYANLAGFPATGSTDRLYVAQDTAKLYRWNGSTYVQIADKASVGLGNVDNTSDTSKPVSTAQQTALDGKQNVLTATAVKTSAYTAAAGDLVPADATSGGFTITLPSAPANNTVVAVKKIDTTTNAVTVQRAGSDVFNITSGPTSLTVTLPDQALTLQYKTSTAIWYVIGHGNTVAGMDTRYFVRVPDTNFGGSQILNSNGAVVLTLDATASAVNYFRFIPPATGGALVIKAEGADSNIDVDLRAKGTGGLGMLDSSGNPIAMFYRNTSAVNYWQIKSSATGNALQLLAVGTDTNIGVDVTTKGTGRFQVGAVNVPTISSTDTLTNKTVDLTSNTLTGTTAQFNTANSDADFYTTAGTDVAVTDGGTGRSTSTTAYGLIAAGTTATGAHQTLAAGATTEVLVGGGASALPAWTTATGTGAPVRGTSPTLAAPDLTGTSKVATGGILQLYNTADQTTNYERIAHAFTGGGVTYSITAEKGGTGATKNINIVSHGTFAVNSNGTPGFSFNDGTGTAGSSTVLVNGSHTASSGSQAGLTISNTINQSSSASYVSLLINPTETGTGSGTKRLIDAQVGSTTKWSVDNAGKMSPGGTATIWTSGSGTPEGAVTAVVGSLFTRTDGAASTTLYVKESGSGNTGWVAK